NYYSIPCLERHYSFVSNFLISEFYFFIFFKKIALRSLLISYWTGIFSDVTDQTVSKTRIKKTGWKPARFCHFFLESHLATFWASSPFKSP
ncbi:hypothetical protein, partial [Halalkalibacter flavus]|uniref:hypothetical protein n=1 Tax=Halalkalibacter flavus TaxID=3090668 RepID=UPI002FC772AA